MSYVQGNIIDKRFEVEGLCSASGGMGEILFVKDLHDEFTDKVVLKYCKSDEAEYIRRFKREVRLVTKFEGNPKVVNLMYENTENEPPYFVMKYYEKGDLTTIVDTLVGNGKEQERVLYLMIDCIHELHQEGIFHRDIKPQNFLIDEENIVVSDFGLGMEPNSSSRFTNTHMSWGTQGFLPPEFSQGGFKYADERGDIYMLGKSFYTLLTQKDPAHLDSDGLHPVLYGVIEKACELNKDNRYSSVEELKQAIKIAYDVILSRGKSIYTEILSLIQVINKKLNESMEYNPDEIIEFLEKLALIKTNEQILICQEYIVKPFFGVSVQNASSVDIKKFLNIYKLMIEKADYAFHFAESIAANMKIIFDGENIEYSVKALALELAMRAAYLMSRFAAMDICTDMICSVTDDTLGQYVSAVIISNQYDFITDIEPSSCKCDSVVNAISIIQKEKEAKKEEKEKKEEEVRKLF